MGKKNQKSLFGKNAGGPWIPLNGAARKKVFKMSIEKRREEQIAPMKQWPRNVPRRNNG